jgi:hypothetical protein
MPYYFPGLDAWEYGFNQWLLEDARVEMSICFAFFIRGSCSKITLSDPFWDISQI